MEPKSMFIAYQFLKAAKNFFFKMRESICQVEMSIILGNVDL